MSTITNKFLLAEDMILTDQGPCLTANGVSYRVWALGHESVVAHVESATGEKRQIELEQTKNSGYFFGIDPKGAAGDLYRFSIDGGDPVPDFASHFQPQGVMGPSMVVDGK